jgi:very-short-patch-repair endonuclease
MSNQHATQLRSRLTDAERILWRRLRVFRSHGFHFRRQAPFENYTLDFVCHRAKLIVELDGSQHAAETQIRHDEKRTRLLEGQGYRVLRIWNNDVFENPDGVAEAVLAVARSPHPIPRRVRSSGSTSPRRGR